MGGSAVLVRKWWKISEVYVQEEIAKINYCFKKEYIKLRLEQQKLLFEEICQDRVRTLLSSSNSTTFHDFFKFSKTLGLVVTFKKFKNFPCFRVVFDLKQFNRHKLWFPPKCMPFAQFNYSSLSYIVLALSSEVTKLPKKTLIFHDFQGPIINSMIFQAWKIKFLNSMTFQVFHHLYEPYRTYIQSNRY